MVVGALGGLALGLAVVGIGSVHGLRKTLVAVVMVVVVPWSVWPIEAVIGV